MDDKRLIRDKNRDIELVGFVYKKKLSNAQS